MSDELKFVPLLFIGLWHIGVIIGSFITILESYDKNERDYMTGLLLYGLFNLIVTVVTLWAVNS